MIILRDKQYTETLEQKEFGFKRKVVATIGKARRNIGTKLEKSIDTHIDKLNESYDKVSNMHPIRNNELDKKLMNTKPGKISNTIISGETSTLINKKSNKSIVNQRINSLESMKNPTPNEKIELETLKSGKNVIKYNRGFGGGSASLAYELGHIQNSQSKSIKGLVSKADDKARSFYERERSDNKGSIKNTIKDFVSGKVISAEEKNASNNGIKLLKKSGASDKELSNAKEMLKESGNTYKEARKITNRGNLRDIVQLKSRKKDPNK
jgi:hypothetical protein